MNFPSLESISWNLKLNLPWVSMTKWARVFLIPYCNLSDVPTLGGFRGEEGEPHGFSSRFIEIHLQKGAQIIIVELRFSRNEHSNMSTHNLEPHQPS